MQVFRKRPDGEIYLPHPDRAGRYVLGNPQYGNEKHHAKNKVLADTLEEAVRLVEQHGFSLRMKGQATKQTNLISPREIQIVR
ncbi:MULTISPECIES: hypothetical protein [unclassified Paracoccus (in: a-proteobacteria)]|uniref:hypothetical protein n=1 Tax=unclassified Paracoccus (in: a-proteobacteria) TaxID=2688777 RepID=UPI0016045E5F|nr:MULTISPECIES: hypothetical protein [unclassified Paracoccus (in: a-proteobacteria)]MBB1490974.1 hypothetical protein [Paracoccus sp. MC1854]MBB1498887.1 hypothetical protein [Paracoccus sp. MC1862]MDO5369217.1 hypothetical protein [Paracoccus sp. (in: a-proteobacteria)]QQO45178.1 hypothetical protein JGR78_01915 [Paracoccus sp. MC1862]